MIDGMAPRATLSSEETDRLESQVWSNAVFMDRRLPGGVTLRALVCSLGEGIWQWSVISLDGARGELIGIGVADSPDGAQRIAVSEIAKCLSDPLA